MPAFGGKADMIQKWLDVRSSPKADAPPSTRFDAGQLEKVLTAP
jgi:hypothetical protein